MTKITFPSGSPKWCREYPEPREYPCLDCTKMDCDAAKCDEKHQAAIDKSATIADLGQGSISAKK